MFVPRALKVKRAADGDGTCVAKKNKSCPSESSSEEASKFREAELDIKEISVSETDSLPVEGHIEPQTSLDSPVAVTEEKNDNCSLVEEPIKSFSRTQRWPEPGEPVCVVCGRYGEYICDQTDEDVCSLECKARHLLRVQEQEKGSKSADSDQVDSQTRSACFDRTYIYQENDFVVSLQDGQIDNLRLQLGITVEGQGFARPIVEFEHCGFPDILNCNLKKSGYEVPTPVQMQMIPVGLQGRDVVATADTGSGKTAAFLLPVIIKALSEVNFIPMHLEIWGKLYCWILGIFTCKQGPSQSKSFVLCKCSWDCSLNFAGFLSTIIIYLP